MTTTPTRRPAPARPRRSRPTPVDPTPRRDRARVRRRAASAPARDASRPMPALRPVGHEDRLSLVEHLDELRTRLIVCVARASSSASASAYWQNDTILDDRQQAARADAEPRRARARANDPLEQNAPASRCASGQAFRSSTAPTLALERAALRALARRRGRCRASARRRRATRALQARRGRRRGDGAPPQAVPTNRERQPVTLGVTEPFMTTFTVAAYAALLLALPLLLFQAYAFVLPAFTPRGAQGRAAADADGAVPVRRRACLRLLRRAAARRRLPAELQRRRLRHPDPGAGLLPLLDRRSWWRSGCCSRSRSACSRSPAWASSRRASCARTAATCCSRSRSLAAVATPTPDPVTMLARDGARSWSSSS